jgi:mycothiol synthase
LRTRNFTWSDLPALTDLKDLIRRAGGEADPLPKDLLKEELGRPGLCPEANCMVVVGDEGPIAFAIVHPEPRISRAVLELNVHPGHAWTGVEPLLVRSGLDRARELGADHVHVCVHDPEPWAGLLAKNGFSKIREYLVLRWQGPELDRPEPPDGFKLRGLRPGEEDILTRAQNEAFTGSWGFSPNTTEEVAYRVAMSGTGHDGVILLQRGDDVAGYCWTRILGPAGRSVGLISMIGVAPAYRGKGLSKPLLLRGMEYMKGKGVRSIKLEVDRENAPAIGLYTSVGFRKEAKLHWFEERLSGE